MFLLFFSSFFSNLFFFFNSAWQAKELVAHLNDAIGTTYAVHISNAAKRIEIRSASISTVNAIRRMLQNFSPVECVVTVGLGDAHEELSAFIESDSLDKMCVEKYLGKVKEKGEM